MFLNYTEKNTKTTLKHCPQIQKMNDFIEIEELLAVQQRLLKYFGIITIKENESIFNNRILFYFTIFNMVFAHLSRFMVIYLLQKELNITYTKYSLF